MAKIITVIIGCFVLLVACITLATFLSHNKLAFQNNWRHHQQITQRIEAKFDAPANINIFILYFKNPGLNETAEYKFGIEQNGKLLRSQMFSARNTGDPSDLRFQFEPIAEFGELTVFIEPTVADGKLSAAVASDNSLAFASYYRDSWSMSDVTAVIEKVFADSTFVILWLGSIIGVCAVILLF